MPHGGYPQSVLILIVAGLVAGLATFLSPCVLPMVPVVLASGTAGGRRRPVGIAIGLAVTFVLATLLASRGLSALGLPQDLVRNLGIALLAIVGVMLLWPRLADLAGRPFRPLQAMGGTRLQTGDGFLGGLAIGAGLGVVWSPCAGPILTAVTVVAARNRIGADALVLSVSYAIGAALPLLGIALLGQRATDRMAGLRAHAPTIRRVTGGVLVAAAALFTTSVPENLAAAAPGYTDVLQVVERSDSVSRRLRDVEANGDARTAAATPGARAQTQGAGTALQDYGPAPEFAGISAWLGTPGGKPLTLAGLRGRVVLIDFWTYSCINCLRTLPQVTAWDAKYRAAGLTIVGVHSPEFAFEHVVSNIKRAIGDQGIRYPVAVDNDLGTWSAWGNQYWPAEYLIDKDGHVRYASFGEGDYDKTEQAIRDLLGEPAATIGPSPAIQPSNQVVTPETYLGSERGQSYAQVLQGDTPSAYTLPRALQLNQVGFGGTWTIEGERIVAGPDAVLELNYQAPHAYLVMAPPKGKAATVRASLDGKPIDSIRVDADDLYTVAAPPGAARVRMLQLRLPPGTSAYAFTFG
jgi:cytochrome c biogenesis protein CcdA/thiol-disulfide isomerase/thioredoxin